MWKIKVDVYYEPHCEMFDEELQIVIPVCRDRLREKVYRIVRWEREGWSFEKLETEEEICPTCEPPLLKTFIEKLLKKR